MFTAETGSVSHPLTGETLAPRPLFGQARTPAPRMIRVKCSPIGCSMTAKFLLARGGQSRLGRIDGRGVVDPVDDLRATNPPSNPALLDALAEEFRRMGYDQKELLRLITGSYVYSLASEPSDGNVADTHNFSRHYRQRLEAEVLLDALGDVTEVRDSYSAPCRPSRGRLSCGRIASIRCFWMPLAGPTPIKIRPANEPATRPSYRLYT